MDKGTSLYWFSWLFVLKLLSRIIKYVLICLLFVDVKLSKIHELKFVQSLWINFFQKLKGNFFPKFKGKNLSDVQG
jgi:uncharacterized protein YlbG (UPF0298 family)